MLVNAELDEKGEIKETEKHTGIWAWKHTHGDGTVTYTRLAGDIVFEDVTFSYDGKKTVLNDVSLYAKPGQKIAFVGSTVYDHSKRIADKTKKSHAFRCYS